MTRNDRYFMAQALELARRGFGKTSPNPLVGAVVVNKGRIVGSGFHKKAGGPHAEVEALKRAGQEAKGATLYVNLEPCNHFGKTPPCTDFISASEVRKVIFGMRDPNPINNGAGMRALKRRGIKIKEGVLKKEAEELNRPFIKFITKKIPYITCKVAQSLDGKIATKRGDSKWITGSSSLRYVHRMRAGVDAVLVGINTVLEDDPLLTPRFLSKKPARKIKKIVLDSRLRISYKSRLLLRDPQSVIIAATKKASSRKLAELRKKGVDVIIVRSKRGLVDIETLLKELAGRQIVHILVEGGGRTIASFLEAGLVDEIFFFISPKIIGGRTTPTSVDGEGIKFLRDAIRLDDVKIERFGKDILIRAKPQCLQA